MATQRTSSTEPLFGWVNQHVWLDGVDINAEYKQAAQEGRDLSSVEADFRRLLAVPKPDDSWHQHLGGQRDAAWWRAAGELVDKVQTLPMRADFSYVEPSDLAGIQAARPKGPRLAKYGAGKAKFIKQLHGGWLGRICGCMLGKPVEGWSRRDIRISAEGTENWPLADYLRVPTARETKAIKARNPKRFLHDKWGWKRVVRPHIDGMCEDDDTNYTTTGFAIVKQHGRDFTAFDVASFWGGNIPIFHTCTAERVAYRNFVNFVLPPESAAYRNPYREWIGAQIRADYFGYANPGKPARAAEWAWRDACISHIKNGIYGEMWVAAMLAAAYVEKDWVKVLRAGLGQIPARCRLAEDVGKIVAAWQAGASYEAAVDLIHAQWDEKDHHDWCHTNTNAQVVTAALLYGEDDYSETITRAVMAGFDTDCNGATAGSLWGVMHGVEAIPAVWTKPIRDSIQTGVAGYHRVKISDLAREMAEVAVREGALG